MLLPKRDPDYVYYERSGLGDDFWFEEMLCWVEVSYWNGDSREIAHLVVENDKLFAITTHDKFQLDSEVYNEYNKWRQNTANKILLNEGDK